MPIIRPDYSSDSDFDDEYGYDYIPRPAHTPYKPPEKDYQTQVYESALYDTGEKFIQLLKNNSNKTDFVYDGWSLLMVTASHGQYQKMEYLLQLGLDPNYNYNLFTPLLAVCDSSKPESDLIKCIQLLEQYDTQFNTEDRHGTTPLMYATKNGHVNIVKHLINKCPNSINTTDNESQSALFYAVIHNHPEIVELLLEANAETNVHDLQGRTPVEIAILKQYNSIVELLQPGYLAQQEQELLALHQDRSSFKTYDYITMFKENLPDHNYIEETGFFTNVIEILGACNLLDFSSTLKENQTSLFQLINSNNDFLQKNNIYMSYQRNEILKNIKLFNLQQWKMSRSLVNVNVNKTNIKMDEFIHYVYLICEQLYVDHCAFNYVENYGFQLVDLKKKYDTNYVNTLIHLGSTLDQYERFVEKEILKQDCLHLPGYIKSSNNSKWVKYTFSSVVAIFGLGMMIRLKNIFV